MLERVPPTLMPSALLTLGPVEMDVSVFLAWSISTFCLSGFSGLVSAIEEGILVMTFLLCEESSGGGGVVLMFSALPAAGASAAMARVSSTTLALGSAGFCGEALATCQLAGSGAKAMLGLNMVRMIGTLLQSAIITPLLHMSRAFS